MLSALSAALLFCACTLDDITGTVIPLGTNESFSVSDTAIVYNMANDTARITITYWLETDTVRNTIVEHLFDDSQQAMAFFDTYTSDEDLRSLSLNNRTVKYSISNCDGLSARNIVDMLKGEYLYNEATTDTLVTSREFSLRNFNGLKDGMYFMLSRKSSNGRHFFHNNSMRGDWLGTTYINDRSCMPWRLWKAPSNGWYMQMCNGSYLRRSGNRLVPMALTATPSPELATAWNLDDVVDGLNFWTILTTIGDTKDFYGLTTEEDGILRIAFNTLETYTLLVNHVKMTFSVADETWTTLSSVWGCDIPLPSYTDPHEGFTFIGWNTTENTIEGYLTSGTLVPADDTTYYAIFVQTK